MNMPTAEEIAFAYDYAKWLRTQDCFNEGRMLCDLGYEVQRLREEIKELRAASPNS